jgi:hypothetical protein
MQGCEEECNCWGAGSGALVGGSSNAAMQRCDDAGSRWVLGQKRGGAAEGTTADDQMRARHGQALGFGGSTSSRRRLEIGQIFCAAVGTHCPLPSAQQSPVTSHHYPLRLLAVCCRPGCCHWLPLRHTHPAAQALCRSGALALWHAAAAPGGWRHVCRWQTVARQTHNHCLLRPARRRPSSLATDCPRPQARRHLAGQGLRCLRHCGIVIASRSRQGNQGSQSSQSSQRRHAMSQLVRRGGL